jgi:glycosyltransferase involved in cell wall biosynthesis
MDAMSNQEIMELPTALHSQEMDCSYPDTGDDTVMAGKSIICFAKDWSEAPTSNNHVMTELAKHNRVLWLNSVATRSPKLGSARDLKKILMKLKGFFTGPMRVNEKLWVYTPIVLPLPHSRWAAVLNRMILRFTIRRLRARLSFDSFQLWTFLPNIVNYLDGLGETVTVYYCVDEWSKFAYLDGPKIEEAERRLCERADVVFASAASLVTKRLVWNGNTHLARHGVDHALFSSALAPATPIPPDIASLPQPVIGFYGTLQDWVDLDLIEHLAKRHPEWSIVLIGKSMVDLSKIQRYPNVHLLGRKDHAELPAYCKAFSVGIIPYVVNERIIHVNPLKLREYLCAGLPVVSVAIPEVEQRAGFCTIAESADQFEAAIVEALASDSVEARRRRSESMRTETWAHRVGDIAAEVLRLEKKKCRAQ